MKSGTDELAVLELAAAAFSGTFETGTGDAENAPGIWNGDGDEGGTCDQEGGVQRGDAAQSPN